MTGTELCIRVIQNLVQGIPPHPDDLSGYLLDQFHRFTIHPCGREVSAEIGRILTTHAAPADLLRFCTRIDDPNLVLTPLIRDLDDDIANHDHDSAADLLRFLLPFTDRPWPEQDGVTFCSFRDLIEYLYYQTVIQPEQEIVAVPNLQTTIHHLHGRYLAMTGDPDSALHELMEASRENPVHAGILGDIVALLLKSNRTSEVPSYLLRSFGCAWNRDELAQAYQNQGYFLAQKNDHEGAICCYLMAETWEETHQGREELMLLAQNSGGEPDREYYNTHGLEILKSRNIPSGPDPEITRLLVMIADDYLEEGNLLRARDYLIRAHLLLMSDELEDRIRRVEQFVEDQIDY